MATLKGSTIAGTYDQLIKRQDSYSSNGNQIEVMNDSGTMVTTALYLDAVNKRVGINSGATVDSHLHVQNSGNTDTQLKIECTYDAASADTVLQCTVANDDASNIIQFGDDASASVGSINYDHQDNTMTFTSGASDNNLVLSTGNVGIGTATPAALLHLYSTTADNPILYIEHASTGNHGGAITFRNKDTDSVLGDNKEMGTINFQGWDGDSNVTGARIRATVEGTASDAVMPSDLSFWTTTSSGSLTQAMTIGANGKVGIGTTSTSVDLAVTGKSGAACILMLNAAAAYDSMLKLAEAGTVKWVLYNDADDDSVRLTDQEGDDGVYVADNGDAWADASDERSKTSLTPIENAVDKLNTLQAVNFKWKYGSERRRTKNNLGLLAQEVNKVFPEAVDSPDESLYKVIDHPIFEGEKRAENQWGIAKGTLIPVLVKAVQELSAKVTALENA